MRDRIREQFTQRYDEHTATQAELDALTSQAASDAGDPDLLDELPYAPGLLASAPAALQEALYAAFDIQVLAGPSSTRPPSGPPSPAPPPASSPP